MSVVGRLNSLSPPKYAYSIDKLTQIVNVFRLHNRIEQYLTKVLSNTIMKPVSNPSLTHQKSRLGTVASVASFQRYHCLSLFFSLPTPSHPNPHADLNVSVGLSVCFVVFA